MHITASNCDDKSNLHKALLKDPDLSLHVLVVSDLGNWEKAVVDLVKEFGELEAGVDFAEADAVDGLAHDFA